MKWRSLYDIEASADKITRKLVDHLIKEGIFPKYNKGIDVTFYKKFIRNLIGSLEHIVLETGLDVFSKTSFYIQQHPVVEEYLLRECSFFVEDKNSRLIDDGRFVVISGYGKRRGDLRNTLYSMVLKISVSPEDLKYSIERICYKRGPILLAQYNGNNV